MKKSPPRVSRPTSLALPSFLSSRILTRLLPSSFFSFSLLSSFNLFVPCSSNPSETTLRYIGEGASGVPLNPFKNLITRTALYVLRSHSISSFPPHLLLNISNDIPFGRGLGSSGAAVIAGVILGSQLGKLDLPLGRILDFALMVERHPDNVTAALVGGFVGSYLRELSEEDMGAASVPLAEVLPEYPEDAGPEWGMEPPIPPFGIGHFVRFGWAKEVKAIAIVPRFELSTAKARAVLPTSYSRADLVSSQSFSFESRLSSSTRRDNLRLLTLNRSCFSLAQVFNLQRLAVLTTALGQSPPDPELIYEAMKDRVHQPYRKELVRPFSPLVLLLTLPLPSIPTSHSTTSTC